MHQIEIDEQIFPIYDGIDSIMILKGMESMPYFFE